jgi:hypothetical protein
MDVSGDLVREMTEAEKQEILRTSRLLLEEALQFPPRDPTAVDVLERRRKMRPKEPEQERRRDPDSTDAMRSRMREAAFREEIGAAIAAEHTLVVGVLGEIVAHLQDEFVRLLDDQGRAHEAALKSALAEMRLDQGSNA